MALFRCRKMRFLYLLALLQLVGGPLVLLHVTVFCKLTTSKTPEMGVAQAAVSAWHAEGFQEALLADALFEKGARKEGDGQKPKPDLGKVKQPVVPWEVPRFTLAGRHKKISAPCYGVAWTPLWPNAPPGPPPRLG